MTRRSVTTINVLISLRIPPGSNAGQMLDFISRALSIHKTSGIPTGAISAIDLDSLTMKLAKRETTYL